MVQSLTREAGGHRGSFPLTLIILIQVGTVCTCHCICLSLCDFGALGSLEISDFPEVPVLPVFTTQILPHLDVLCVTPQEGKAGKSEIDSSLVYHKHWKQN